MTVGKHAPFSTMRSNSCRTPPINHGALVRTSDLSDRTRLGSREASEGDFIVIFMAVEAQTDRNTSQIDK
jgi:hypothetical protein